MRNIFDQYQQSENRLTHALAVCLNEDRALLRAFLNWIGVSVDCAAGDLTVVEQSLPGDPPEWDESEDQRNSLPDVVIHDGEAWGVLIESKIEARLTPEQLARHKRTMRRRGFHRIWAVALTKAGVSIPDGVIGRTWCGLYEWLGQSRDSRGWASRLREYLRVAEVRLSRDGYLTEGTLTMFDGFPFSDKNPYTYGEAKRLLKLAMAELRRNKALRKLGVKPFGAEQKVVTGTWDCILLKEHPDDKPHTGFPHLTLGVFEEGLSVAIVIPNDVSSRVLNRLTNLGSAGIRSINAKILKKAAPLVKTGAWVGAYAQQRHWASRSSEPTVDASVEFSLETSRGKGQSKAQPEWGDLFLSLLRGKCSNIQFGYESYFPWGTPGLNSRASLDMIVQAWSAMDPLLDVLRGKPLIR